MYIHDLAEEVCTLVRPLVQDGVELVNRVPPDLPPAAVERSKLQRILFNLVGNAARFTLVGACASR